MAEPNFIDYIKVFTKSGKGGAGSSHLHRDRRNPKGGPDGGDGGRGGHIIIRGNRNLWTLLHLRYHKHIAAGNGENGSKSLSSGADGKDEIIEVPLGTIVKDEITGELSGEITMHEQEIIIRKGGRGGLGNNHFKSSVNQTPRYSQPGEKGNEGWSVFELKILADVGLVGFPNAGKSTLLAAVSAAKPKIANYPFTTITPNIGIVRYKDFLSFVMADIPGIIEGASEGKGLGLRFLRHIERNSVLLFMVPCDSENINYEYDIILKELEKYNPALLEKKRILGVSKTDLLDSELALEIRKEITHDCPVIFFSAVTGSGIEELKNILWHTLNS